MADWETLAEDFGNLPKTRANVTIIDGTLAVMTCHSDVSPKAARMYGALARECDSRPYGWESLLWERFPDYFHSDSDRPVTKDSEGRLLEFRTVDNVGRLSERLALELAKADSPSVEPEDTGPKLSEKQYDVLRVMLKLGAVNPAEPVIQAKIAEYVDGPGATTGSYKRPCSELRELGLTGSGHAGSWLTADGIALADSVS